MAESVALGVSGMSVAPGNHVCAFYRGVEERDDILIPYLQEGLRAGDKCICIVDATDPDAPVTMLGAETELEAGVSRQQLDLFASSDTYLRHGPFCAQEMLDFWGKTVAGALVDGGFSFVRVVGEMTWALGDLPGVEEYVVYESELNRFLPQYPQVFLCLYDLEQCSGDKLVCILKTHPKMLMGRSLLDSPYYLEPDEFLAARG